MGEMVLVSWWLSGVDVRKGGGCQSNKYENFFAGQREGDRDRDRAPECCETIAPDATRSFVLPCYPYASGAAGYGWRVDRVRRAAFGGTAIRRTLCCIACGST